MSITNRSVVSLIPLSQSNQSMIESDLTIMLHNFNYDPVLIWILSREFPL